MYKLLFAMLLKIPTEQMFLCWVPFKIDLKNILFHAILIRGPPGVLRAFFMKSIRAFLIKKMHI